MHNRFKIVLFLLFIFPCCAFSFNVNDYFKQAIMVVNDSSQPFVVVEPSREFRSPAINDKEYGVIYDYNQFTVAEGQNFNHIIEIHSAANDQLICTVTTHLVLGPGDKVQFSKPTSTNMSKCITGIRMYKGIFVSDVSVRD